MNSESNLNIYLMYTPTFLWIQSLLTIEITLAYVTVIEHFVQWCDTNHLIINLRKTAEKLKTELFDSTSFVYNRDCFFFFFTHTQGACGPEDKMILFYRAVLERRYGMSAWSGNVTTQLKNKLARLVQTSMKAMGEKINPFSQHMSSLLSGKHRRHCLTHHIIIHEEY